MGELLNPTIAIFIAALIILGGAGIAGGVVIALVSRGSRRKLGFWVTIAGIVLSGSGFWIFAVSRSTI